MYVRKGTPADLPAIMNIIKNAQAYLAAQGIDQWQDGYPNDEAFLKDMENGYCRVAVEEAENGETVLGVSAFIPTGEPDYAVIHDGAWLNDGRYMTVHRVAVDSTLRRKGIASFLLAAAVEEAKELDLSSLRLDTHMENVVMQATLLRNGLTKCGTIILGRANVSDPTGLPDGPVTPDMVPAKFLRWGYEKLI